MTPGKSIWIKADEIAQLLDLTTATFRRNVARLTERDGFPLPSSHRLKPITWRRAAVEAWINSQGYSADDLRGVPNGQDPGAANVHLLRLAEAG
ncbi:hypothetical protein [Roseobacter sp.]|uniref:helix-turn-helix transcriptional regulator n=1 Tax=Roseobacter sp. TaxID=1907202 RepID=UPI0029675CC1|nr:hypothetical protein [Roseobacter sp.]MDW3181743.1 hypothetical protein [Roseobacter sp.]